MTNGGRGGRKRSKFCLFCLKKRFYWLLVQKTNRRSTDGRKRLTGGELFLYNVAVRACKHAGASLRRPFDVDGYGIAAGLLNFGLFGRFVGKSGWAAGAARWSCN